MSTSTCLFLLKTNAGFYRQHGYLTLKQRVKEALLYWDELVFEDGLYDATVGPTGSVSLVSGIDENFDSEQQRAIKASGGEFLLAVGGRVMVQGVAVRRFFAEFRSLLGEISQENGGKLPGCVRVSAWDLRDSAKRTVQELSRRDVATKGFWKRSGGSWLRDLVVDALNSDLVLSGILGHGMAPDGYFAPLLARKKGLRSPVGPSALRVLVPDLSRLSWGQIMELRSHPGFDAFREHLAEIESQARATASEHSSLESRVMRQTVIDLAQGWRAPGGLETAGKVALDLVLGLLPVGGAVSAVSHIRDAETRTATWGAFFLRALEAANASSSIGEEL